MNNEPYEKWNADEITSDTNLDSTARHSDTLTCECSDVGCSVHIGQSCVLRNEQTLYRIDMDDWTGTRFCEKCASDAMDSGLFTDETQVDNLDSDDDKWFCPSCRTVFDSLFLDACPICRGKVCERRFR